MEPNAFLKKGTAAPLLDRCVPTAKAAAPRRKIESAVANHCPTARPHDDPALLNSPNSRSYDSHRRRVRMLLSAHSVACGKLEPDFSIATRNRRCRYHLVV